MLPFHDVVRHDFDNVNQLIIKQLHSNVDLVENIGHYIVESGGKRLRPLLVLLSARSLGYTGEQHIDLAAIIEFIHTATLLHDDVVDLSSGWSLAADNIATQGSTSVIWTRSWPPVKLVTRPPARA